MEDGNRSLNVTIKQCLSLFKSNELNKVISNYEKDIVTLQQREVNYMPSSSKSTLYKKRFELIQLGQLKIARQIKKSDG